MEDITISPVAFVFNSRKEPVDDFWGNVVSEIELTGAYSEDCLQGISFFSHLEIIYYFHKSTITVTGSEFPRENPDWPKVGIFSQRKKDRPNHLGSTIVNLIKVEGRKLIVRHLDAIDGTPVIDIKPVYYENLPKGTIEQPVWTKELMEGYWE
jgi:tRNA (adenine37-N6)-methyltransferase